MVDKKYIDTQKIGFMQGRLTAKGGFSPQMFPWTEWEKEFELASHIGFCSMEWMFNSDRWERNPIIEEEGIETIIGRMKETGVTISAICLNYFMQNSIFSSDEKEKNITIFNKIIQSARKIGCGNVILPLFDKSELFCDDKIYLDKLSDFLEAGQTKGINICLETDLPMDEVAEFVKKRMTAGIGICYDIGNAAGSGKNVIEELKSYSEIIKNVHIKDKKRGKSSVMLGRGDAPLKEALEVLKGKYNGYYILESYYNQDALADTIKNYQYVKGCI